MAQIMNLTNVLLVAILLILLRQFYPDVAPIAVSAVIGVGVVYFGHWLLITFPAQRKTRKATREQEKNDENEFWEYQAKHNAIRAKYDPRNEWNEASSVPREYEKEIHDLNLQHSRMLQRRNGWTADDFEEQ